MFLKINLVSLLKLLGPGNPLHRAGHVNLLTPALPTTQAVGVLRVSFIPVSVQVKDSILLQVSILASGRLGCMKTDCKREKSKKSKKN